MFFSLVVWLNGVIFRGELIEYVRKDVVIFICGMLSLNVMDVILLIMCLVNYF